MLRDWCWEIKDCKTQDPAKKIRFSVILSRIFKENLNDMATGVTWQGIGLVAAVIALLACCFGRCSCGKTSGEKA